MNVNEFSDEQKRALLELLVLGMYADGNLDLIETEKAKRVLDAIKFPSDSERQYFLDASYARARKHLASAELTRKFVAEMAGKFPTPVLRRQVYNLLEDSLSSDNNIARTECDLLLLVSEEFKL